MNVLRPYQREAVASVDAQFAAGVARTLVVMATGTGKTTVFSQVAATWPGRVLVLAHRTELVSQAKLRLESDLGEPVGVEQGPQRAAFERIVVASVQTVSGDSRLQRLRNVCPPSLIIADEAHHAPAKTWKKVMEAFPDAKVLGVTATPDRGDGSAMGLIFDSVAFSYDLPSAVADGWLVPLRGEVVRLSEVNLDLVGSSAGDLAAGQLDEQMAQGAEGIVRALHEVAGGRQGIVFCPGVRTAHYVADRINRFHPGRAAAIDGKTNPAERALTIERFRRGEVWWLANCMVFTEGTDLPTAEVAAIARPTRSRALYTQMVGRVGRVLPGVVDGLSSAEERSAAIARSFKPHGLILDFCGNNTRHTLATPEDILGGDYDPAERQKARELREGGELEEGATVTDYLKEAREAIRRAAGLIQSQVVLERVEFNPLELGGVDLEVEEERLKAGRRPASEKQLSVLRKLGVTEDLSGISHSAASRILKGLGRRKKLGLATPKQLALLKRYGAGDPGIDAQRASNAIDYIASTGWGRTTDAEKVRRMCGV